MTERILILGGTSDIARHAARRWAERGAALCLVGRDETRLARVKQDLEARGSKVSTQVHDLTDACEASFEQWVSVMGGVDKVVVAYGYLGDQARGEGDLEEQARIFEVNFASAANWIHIAARHMAGADGGSIAVFGSVAGDRVRRSNYLYGSAKHALHGYVAGARLRYQDDGVHILLFKPGQTRTAMTAHMDTDGPMWSDPEVVAHDLVRSLDRKKDVAYSPGFWRIIMLIIRTIPGFIFKRLPL